MKKVVTSALDTINAIEVVEYDLLGDDGEVRKVNVKISDLLPRIP